MRIPGILLWKLNLTRADVDVASAITTFFSWLVLAFPRGSPPPSVPVFITVAISDDPGSGSLSATVLLAIWGSLAMARSTVCWASPAGLEATQVKAPGTENKKIIVPDVHSDTYNDNTEQNATFQVQCFIFLLQFRGSSCLYVDWLIANSKLTTISHKGIKYPNSAIYGLSHILHNTSNLCSVMEFSQPLLLFILSSCLSLLSLTSLKRSYIDLWLWIHDLDQ